MALGPLGPLRTAVLGVLGPVHGACNAGAPAPAAGGQRIGDEALERAHGGATGRGVQDVEACEYLIQGVGSGLDPQTQVVTAQVDESQEVGRADGPVGTDRVEPVREARHQRIRVVSAGAVDARVQPVDLLAPSDRGRPVRPGGHGHPVRVANPVDAVVERSHRTSPSFLGHCRPTRYSSAVVRPEGVTPACWSRAGSASMRLRCSAAGSIQPCSASREAGERKST